jgi:hypothetical protein
VQDQGVSQTAIQFACSGPQGRVKPRKGSRSTKRAPLARHSVRGCLSLASPLEELNRPLVALGGRAAGKRTEISASPGARILLAGVKPILSDGNFVSCSTPSFQQPLLSVSGLGPLRMSKKYPALAALQRFAGAVDLMDVLQCR